MRLSLIGARYQCQARQSQFDDLSCTILAGHHQPLQTWILCLYLMGLNLSTHQVATELDLNKDDAQQMTSQLRSVIVEKNPEVILDGVVELDELYGNCWLQRSASRGKKKRNNKTA